MKKASKIQIFWAFCLFIFISHNPLWARRAAVYQVKFESFIRPKPGDIYVSKSDTLRILTDSTFEMSYYAYRNTFKKNCPGYSKFLHGCILLHKGNYRFENNTLSLGYSTDSNGKFAVVNYYHVRNGNLYLKEDLSNYLYRRRAKLLFLG